MPAALACALVADFVLTHLPGLSGDTIALVHGARTIAYCLGHGIDSQCDRLARFVPGGAAAVAHHQIVEGAVAPYALFQYLPALLLTQLGAADLFVYKAFSVISLVSFCAVVAIAGWLATRVGRRWLPPLVVVLLTTSPLVYYAWLTFGESLAALLMILLAAAALLRSRPLWLAVTALLACLTKETVFPVVAIVGAVALWATPIASRPLRRSHWVGLGIGTLAGVAVSAAFDWFRYGQLTNYTYGHSFEQVPGVVHRLALSVALWVSPNGGVGWFWPLATLVVIGLVVVAATGVRAGGLRRRSLPAAGLRRRSLPAAGLRRRTLPAAGLVVALLLITGTLASWFAPFGWVAWGPRLILPTLPAIVVVAVIVYHRELERVLRVALGGAVRATVVGAVVIVVALPQVNVLHAGQVVGQLFAPDATCPSDANVGADPDYYYHCLNHWAWNRHSVLVSTYHAFDDRDGVIFAAAFALVWLGSLYLSASALRAPRVHRVPEAVVAGGAAE